MPTGTGTKLVFRQFPLVALSNTTPSTTTPTYISMKGYNHLTVVIMALNAATVTGSAITLKQATAVAGTSEKALSFAFVYQNIDTAAASALTETAVVSDTFTTDATNSKSLLYVIEVDADTLDRANSFDCVRVGTGNATASTLTVLYILSGQRYSSYTLPTVDPLVD